MRLLCSHGFFGLLLMHMRYSVDEETETAYTDGERINFGADFLDALSDDELDFVMMHEIMHVVLQHCLRGEDCDNHLFNVACDIVVNSNILLEKGMDTRAITLSRYGEAMHLAPDGKEGYEYTAEQVYAMVIKDADKMSVNGAGSLGGSVADDRGESESDSGSGDGSGAQFDDHSMWGKSESPEKLRDEWLQRLRDAAEAIEIRDASTGRGTMPLFAKRLLSELRKPQTDWRTVLNEFIQEDVVDYSFCPPDRRFDGGDFFLPDFNEKDEKVEDILFMIDTSGSMSDAMITAAFSEIKGAIDQFGGKLKGWLGFFDAAVIPPEPFSNEEEFRVIRPKGGGGTDFDVIFKYIGDNMEEPPASVIILTDGYAPFPSEEESMGIPTLWLINNENVTPPWGKIARISI